MPLYELTSDNTGAQRISNVGFTSTYQALSSGQSVVDVQVEVSTSLVGDQGIAFVQVFDSAAAPPSGAQALYSWPVNASDRFTHSPSGREDFAAGLFIGLSSTDRVYTPLAENALHAIVRYMP